MKRFLIYILLVAPLIISAQPKDTQKKVLMVVSSYGKEMGEIRPGYEIDEFSQAYLVFTKNNFLVDIASPKGGSAEADKFNAEKEYNKAILDDPTVMELLENTKPTSSIDAAEYDAIYVVGGKGAMFDLPFDPSLQDIILHLYQKEGAVISSVCHGPAAFVNVKDGDEYIIKDVEVTSFCNIEEELFGKKWVGEFPFKLEDKLVSRGANFTQTDFMLSHVAVSGKFITGQNPFSTTKSAEEVVKALGITPAKRELYNDERSVYLMQDILDNKHTIKWAEKELKKNEDRYDFPLIATYGYYKILASEDREEELREGTKLIELSSPYFFHERLEMLLAQSYVKLDESDRAKNILNELISKNLLSEEAEELLKQLD